MSDASAVPLAATYEDSLTESAGPQLHAQAKDMPQSGRGPGTNSARYGTDMSALSDSINGLSMHEDPYGLHCRPPTNPEPLAAFGPLGMNAALPAAYWPASAHPMYANIGAYPTGMQVPMFAAAGMPYYGQSFAPLHASPESQAWTSSNTFNEMPTLVTPRRDSMSSADIDNPNTPSYATYAGYPPAGMNMMARSPSATFTASTPSPSHFLASGALNPPKIPDRELVSPRIQAIVRREPAIPPAVPAPSSPLKALDRALENVRGETNVYIRGLLPDTSDEMLEEWGRRFGDTKSSKSIIDHVTGMCKGFGFVRYHNYTDAEDCIRGFHFLGYEVSFARESFYSKLKAIADDGNTNLYVSNLPKAMNEEELGIMFEPHEVLSARILRDKHGIGRGVGFARFEDRKACEEVIKAFNNKTVTALGEEYTVQIRYADTQEQKHLKQTTAAARQFRTAEYEFATQTRRGSWLSPASRSSTSSQGDGRLSQDFENYLRSAPVVPIQHQRWAQSAWRSASTRSPLSAISANRSNVPRRTPNSLGGFTDSKSAPQSGNFVDAPPSGKPRKHSVRSVVLLPDENQEVSTTTAA